MPDLDGSHHRCRSNPPDRLASEFTSGVQTRIAKASDYKSVGFVFMRRSGLAYTQSRKLPVQIAFNGYQNDWGRQGIHFRLRQRALLSGPRNTFRDGRRSVPVNQ